MPEPFTREVGAFTLHTTDATSVAWGDADAVTAREGRLPRAWAEYEDATPVAYGGMGVVYRVRNARLGRTEAVKVLREKAVDGELARQRFAFEAAAAAGLQHPHIVQVYGAGQVNGRPYFAMQWLDGGDLTTRQPELAGRPREVARLVAKVARAVHHAHRHGILHRDLKPSNVLLDAAGEPHVSDFGLAKRTDDDLGVTRAGAVIGTPQYMAPEQATGAAGVTTAADVYGLGGILYYLLAARPPFVGGSVHELMRRIAAEPPTPPGRFAAGTDSDLEAICLKCLEKDPRDRYQSAAELADDLDRFLRGDQVSVRPPRLCAWLCREVRKQPPPFNGYVWQAKLWFGGLLLMSQLVIAAVAWADGPPWPVWLSHLGNWVGCGAVLWYYKAAKFTRLPVTEQHSVMIGVALILAHAAFTLCQVPIIPTARAALEQYPAMFALTGLAYFALGATHWGAFYWMGLGSLALCPVAVAFPPVAPVLYGLMSAAVMTYWCQRIRHSFGRSPDGAASGHC